MILRLHHAQLSIPVGGAAKAREFYCQILGLKEIERPQKVSTRTGFWIELGDIQIHVGEEDGIDRKKTKAHIAYQVEDLERAKELLESNGITVIPGASIPGFDRFEFRDPFGNRVEFLGATK